MTRRKNSVPTAKAQVLLAKRIKPIEGHDVHTQYPTFLFLIRTYTTEETLIFIHESLCRKKKGIKKKTGLFRRISQVLSLDGFVLFKF